MPEKVSHKPTDEQQAIIDAVAKPDGSSLMISAYAGTAKTTTLEMAAPGVTGPALALAFNKKIADELRGRMPDNFQVRTLNGLGHMAWLRAINKPQAAPDSRKLGKLITVVAKDRKIKLTTDQWDIVRQAVVAAMNAGLSPNNEGSPLIEDTEENWRDILEDVIDAEFKFLHEVARLVLIESINLAKAGQISFDDQIYCSTVLGGVWPKFPTVFVDESQDLSPLNHRMLELVALGRIASVGDPKQAIYKFRGADAQSMQNLRRLRAEWIDLMLTLTFRCPKAIVARQQQHAPGYRAYEGNTEGRFLRLPHPPYGEDEDSWNHKSLSKVADEIGAKQFAMLCRNNAPLLDMAFKLIASGIGCVMLGRDIGTGLIRLSKKIAEDDTLDIVDFSKLLTEWYEKEVALATANDKPDKVEKLADQVECLRSTIDGASPSTAGNLRDVLQRMFSRDSGQVILSSIHRAKGLEWPLVLEIDPWRIPSRQAKQAALTGDDSHLIQEQNLRYVAETRSQNTLANADVRDYK